MAKKDRIWYCDILRIASMVFLVIRHSSTSVVSLLTPFGTDWWVCYTYGALSAWMVPVFMMISGCSFLDPNRNITTNRLYRKNIFKMVVFFFFWGFFYAVYNKISGQGGPSSFWTMLFEGHFHLWFLPMIMGMYMLTPMLRLVTKNRKTVIYVTIVTFIVGIVIPTMQDLGLFFDNTLVTGKYNYGYVSAYVAMFFMGYLLHNTDFNKKQRLTIYALGILATVIIFVGTYYLTLQDASHSEDMQGDSNLFPFIQGLAIFIFTKYRLANVNFSEDNKKMILDISGLTFGVYMIHVVLLALLDKLGFSPLTYPASYMVPLLILFVLPSSFFLSWACKHIPVLGKHIV